MKYVTFMELEDLLDKIQSRDVLHDNLSKKELRAYLTEVCKMLHTVWKEEASFVVGRDVRSELKEQQKTIEELRKKNEELKKVIKRFNAYSTITKKYSQCEDKYLKKIEESYSDYYDSDKY